MIEHRPWIGANYDAGIAGKKVMIVGYSHWGTPDHDGMTEEVVAAWASGDENAPFCPRIRSFFGNEEPGSFWQSVAFANTLPSSVGEESDRYAYGSPEQIATVKARVQRLIETVEPDRIFVFSRKAWNIWPDYTGSLRNGTLRVDDVGEFDAGTYTHPAGKSVAFGFTHPQFTPVAPTRIAVGAALAATVDELRPLSGL